MMKPVFFLLITAFLLNACRPSANDLPARVLHPHEELPAGVDEKGYTSVLYNPRQEDWHPEREGEMDYQVNWELDHLQRADFILMNFLPGSQSPITLLELGLFAGSRKLRVICPASFYRYDNVRITCQRYAVPMYETLKEAVESL